MPFLSTRSGSHKDKEAIRTIFLWIIFKILKQTSGAAGAENHKEGALRK
jgi:hypothetical protein